MTRARMPRPHEVAAAKRDPRLIRAFLEREDDGAWRTRGVCQTVDPETFFPAPSEPADAAVALCRTCEVQGACLAWALDVGDCHGVWGATTPRERRAMLVAWRAAEGAEEVLGIGTPVPVAITAAATSHAPAPAPVPAAMRAAGTMREPVRLGDVAAGAEPADTHTEDRSPARLRAAQVGQVARPSRPHGRVPEQRGPRSLEHRPVEHRRGDGELVERVAS
jgi:WhiB family transcriptional regulator, redox-sensing transcriptional regulator